MTKEFIVGWVLFLNTIGAFAQQPTLSIKGTEVDESLQIPIAPVNIVLLNTNPVIRATTDEKGNFVVKNVPVGRLVLHLKGL